MPNVSRLLLVALCVVLAACSGQPKKRAAPAQPVSATPVPTISAVDAQHYERDKERVKLALAKDNRDALAKSEVGYYMDVLEGRLNQVAHVGVTRLGDRIRLDMPGRFDRTGDPRALETLAGLAKVLAEYRTIFVSVRVIGDDSQSKVASRQPEQDAQAIARQLVVDGIDARRIVIPALAPSTTSTGEAGMRIELELEPIVRVDELPPAKTQKQ
jgi:hypothetical protein